MADSSNDSKALSLLVGNGQCANWLGFIWVIGTRDSRTTMACLKGIGAWWCTHCCGACFQSLTGIDFQIWFNSSLTFIFKGFYTCLKVTCILNVDVCQYFARRATLELQICCIVENNQQGIYNKGNLHWYHFCQNTFVNSRLSE